MKKYSIITFMVTVLFLLTACTGQNTTKINITEDVGITSTPTDGDVDNEDVEEDIVITNKPTATDTDFTEGVWIKKYPDNYACFKFESPEGFQIVCDPFDVDETLQPDIVTESHQHSDHTDTSNLEHPYQLITEAGDYSKEDVVIQGYAGKHNKGDIEGTNNIFIIKMKDITIAHFASQGEIPSDEVLEQIGSVDILLIQVFENPLYNKLLINDTDAIINKLKPKIIIPEHGDINAGDILAKHLKNATEDVESSGNIIVTRDMLDKIEGILVINLDNN